MQLLSRAIGPIATNVQILADERSREAIAIDTAIPSLAWISAELAARGWTLKLIVSTHGHWDHIGAVEQVRDAGIGVWVGAQDAAQLPGYDHVLEDDAVHHVGDLALRTIHTPGHTPGSFCFALEGAPILFSGDTLFPGGPGNTTFEGGDFATIIKSIQGRLYRVYDDATIFWPGHGAQSTIGLERPHLDEWVARGW